MVAMALTLAAGYLGTRAAEPAKDAPQERKAAIFVLSREPKIDKNQVKMLEDLIAARVSSQGFQALTRDVIVDSIDRSMQHPKAGAGPEGDQALAQFKAAISGHAGGEKRLEDQLDEQSSVMRLAQTIGADLIVIASVESFGTEKRIFKGNELAPIATTTIFNNLLVSYRLAYAATGSSVAGSAIRVDRTWRESESLSRSTDELLNGMFDEVASKLAAQITAANSQVKEVPKVQASGVKFTVRLALPGGAPLQLPTYVDGDVSLPVSANVSAEILADGIAVGSAPGLVRVNTGLHQIAIQATGFKPWKRFVNVTAGQAFDAVLEMTPESYEKWKDIITFLSDLSRKTKLTNAEVGIMKAKAEAMRKAGLIVSVGDNGLEVIKRN